MNFITNGVPRTINLQLDSDLPVKEVSDITHQQKSFERGNTFIDPKEIPMVKIPTNQLPEGSQSFKETKKSTNNNDLSLLG